MTPHIVADGSHLSQRETAIVLKKSGLSPLGPVAVNTMAPDEGNMYLIGKIGTAEHKRRFLEQMVAGEARSAFFMTEPAEEGGRSEEHTSELQSLMRNSYAVFCLKKKKKHNRRSEE